MELINRILKGKKSKIIAILVVSAVVEIILVYSTRTYALEIDDKYIGQIKSKNAVNELLIDITKNAKANYGQEVFLSSQVSFKNKYFSNEANISNEELKTHLNESIKISIKAFAINVNGTDIAFLKDKQSCEEVLKKIQEPYIQNEEDGKNLSFVENVIIVERDAPVEKVKEIEEAYGSIAVRNDENKNYTVQKGDTLSEIAEKFGMKLDDIKKANPSMKDDNLSIDQEINLTIPRYAINIKKSTVETIEEKVPFEVTYENTGDLYKGDTSVKVKGMEGLKRIEAQRVTVNGILEAVNILKEEILKEQSAQVVLVGTKDKPRTVATGSFGMPSRGSLTSRFGTRWNAQHTGVDFGAPIGTANRAADGGKVTFAGWNGGYGKLIIIDHENGYETYYGHNDTIKVSVGSRVAKGDTIGTVGNTGRSTGPHLHFEVRKNGVPVDPLKYLDY